MMRAGADWIHHHVPSQSSKETWFRDFAEPANQARGKREGRWGTMETCQSWDRRL